MSHPPPPQSVTGNDRPYIGGQALIEGVMMRSPHAFAAVVRRRDGSLHLREEPMADPRVGWRALPLLRGVVTLVESLRLGSRALRFSAELYERDLEEAERASKPASAPSTLALLSLPIVALVTSDPEAPPSGPRVRDRGAALFTWLSIGFALALFVALPQAFAAGTSRLLALGLDVRDAGFQLLTGAAKVGIVVGYMLLIRRMPEIYRVFQYHGAEHKAIAAYEAGEPLTVTSARTKSTLHPRCGTTFLVMVALISVLVFTGLGPFLPRLGQGALLENVLFFFMKLPFLPVIASITFEIQRLLARHCTRGPARALLWPGFLVQRITTIEPEEGQLEVALGALGAALRREQAPAPAAVEDRRFARLDELLQAA